MRPGLRMHGDAVAAGLGKGRQVEIGGRNHQMAVERLVGPAADRLDHRRPERDVGDEMPVHHVEVDPVGAGRRHPLDLLAEP